MWICLFLTAAVGSRKVRMDRWREGDTGLYICGNQRRKLCKYSDIWELPQPCTDPNVQMFDDIVATGDRWYPQ